MKTIASLLFALLLISSTASVDAAPLAAGKKRFLGCAYSAPQMLDFGKYWNKLTSENGGKWASVEAVRGQMDWSEFDKAYNFAQDNNIIMFDHVMAWGSQQPEWMRTLPPAEQLAAIRHWFAAVAERYPNIAMLEVANETLPNHNQPDNRYSDSGNYMQALGGPGVTGVDWVINLFRLARQYFPNTKLMINDYGITASDDATGQYLRTIQLLQRENLIDAIGLQEHAFETSSASWWTHFFNLNTLGSTTGLPIYITEFDIDGPTDAQQLDGYKKFFPLFWENQYVKGVTLWGFRPGLWRDQEGAYLVNKDGSERPALKWLRDFVASTP
ncbi:endo-1,4-beta-xylanase [Xanthomonas albilineans]|uniref:endo-1,4-beta-xylanase n=1 Tax=Xanthomonas albilineans TaxID=29447 RepID=UPI0005F334DB|nr:endo-1,4-beta-xylanase [Xanthomonas albilineans]